MLSKQFFTYFLKIISNLNCYLCKFDENIFLIIPQYVANNLKWFIRKSPIESTPSYSNKHNVSLQYIVQFSKLLSKIWSIFTNCFWVKIFKTLNFPNLSGNFDTKFKLKLLNT
jgi:hypothetical protein